MNSIYSTVNEEIQQIWDGLQGEMKLNWDNLFISNFPLDYEISVGTELGSANIIQWQKSTKNKTTLPKLSTNLKKMYVSVRAINPGGNFITHSAELDISGS